MIRIVLSAVICVSLLSSGATAQVCRVIDPVYEPVPKQPDREAPWEGKYPAPDPNPEVARLLKESKDAAARGDQRESDRKFQEATRVMDRWSKQEVRRLHRSGVAASKQGGPRVPKEVPDIVHIGRAAALLGIETGAMEYAGDVLIGYNKVRLRQLRQTGMPVARQGQPEPPLEVSEAIYLDKQVQFFLSEPGSSGGWDLAQELYAVWGEVRLAKLESEVEESIRAGITMIPRQIREVIKIIQEVTRLGGPYEESLKARADQGLQSIAEQWLARRAERLGASGVAEAAQAGELPPEALAELLGIDREMRKLPVDRTAVTRAAAKVVTAWVDAHMQKLAPPGHEAARAGGPRSPEQVAQLVSFSKQLDCLPEDIAEAAKLPEKEARTIGETHLTVFRDKLACPAKPEELTALRDIATGLESYGWGPYDKRGPNCGWRGTIIQRIEETKSRDTVAHPIGQPIQYKHEKNKWVEIRWEVDGEFAHVTITGGGDELVHSKALVPVCNGQEEKSESKFTVIAAPVTVPVTIRHLRDEDYLIETKSPDYTERTDTHTETADSQACSLKGSEGDETTSFNVRESYVGLPDTAIRIESLTGGQPSRRLDGELKTSTSLNYGKLTSITTWDLSRER